MTEVNHSEVQTAFRNPDKGWLPYSFRPIARPGLPFVGGPDKLDSLSLASEHYTNYFTWQDVEPTEGDFHWEGIDAFLAAQAGKKVSIGIQFADRTTNYNFIPLPAWVRAQIASSTYTNAGIVEPDYRDPIYRTKVNNLIVALAAKWYATPAWRDQIVGFDITPFGVFGEWWSSYALWRRQKFAVQVFYGAGATNSPMLFALDRSIIRDLAGAVLIDDNFSRSFSSGWDSPWEQISGGTAPDYNVNGSAGTMSTPTNTARALGSVAARRDSDWENVFSTDKLALGAAYLIDFRSRQSPVTANSDYMARVTLTTGAILQLSIIRRVGGVSTTLVQNLNVDAHIVNQKYRCRFWVEGINPTTLKAKVWRDGTAEPGAWTLTTTDSDAALQETWDDEKQTVTKALIDSYLNAFAAAPKPQLSMNVVGSSSNGPAKIQDYDAAMIKYAIGGRDNVSMVRRNMGAATVNLKQDELDYILSQIDSKPLHGEFVSSSGLLSWMENPVGTFTKQTWEAIQHALDWKASQLGWWTNTETVSCAQIPIQVTVAELPEMAVCAVTPGASFSANPLAGKNYPLTTETLRDYFQRRSGYRFFIVRSQYAGIVKAGSTLEVVQEWYQRAVAKVYKQYGLRVRLAQEDEAVLLDTNYSAFVFHTWPAGPQGPIPVSSTYDVPEEVLPGEYDLQMAVVDSNGKPCMNLANREKVTTGLSDPINDYGWYKLGKVIVSRVEDPVPAISRKRYHITERGRVVR